MAVADDVALFEQCLSELIIKYEQYFLGVEKREPLPLRNQVESLSRRYQNTLIVNTMIKFRYNSAIARLNSYKNYWNRINRMIDEGKYSRDRFKMAMHQKGDLADHHDKGGAAEAEHKRNLNPEIEMVYRSYLEARKACRLPVDTITPEMIAAAIEKQRPFILKKYKCKGVEFKVVIEQGMPKIKARPRM